MKKENELELEIIEKVKEILNCCFIESAPIPIVDVAKSYGFVVVEKTMEDDDSGFMIILKKGIDLGPNKNVTKIIAINTTETPYRKRFTIAHELGHYFLEYQGKEDQWDEAVMFHREKDVVNVKKEGWANRFAGELLVPNHLLEIELNRLKNFELLFSDVPSVISKKFGISYSAACVRLDIYKRWKNGQE